MQPSMEVGRSADEAKPALASRRSEGRLRTRSIGFRTAACSTGQASAIYPRALVQKLSLFLLACALQRGRASWPAACLVRGRGRRGRGRRGRRRGRGVAAGAAWSRAVVVAAAGVVPAVVGGGRGHRSSRVSRRQGAGRLQARSTSWRRCPPSTRLRCWASLSNASRMRRGVIRRVVAVAVEVAWESTSRRRRVVVAVDGVVAGGRGHRGRRGRRRRSSSCRGRRGPGRGSPESSSVRPSAG